MRISELSQATGVPVATIKYYLREGLLPDGDKRTPRLTEYDDRHVRQLGLLRILREVGQVPVEGLKQLVAASRSLGAWLAVQFGSKYIHSPAGIWNAAITWPVFQASSRAPSIETIGSGLVAIWS